MHVSTDSASRSHIGPLNNFFQLLLEDLRTTLVPLSRSLQCSLALENERGIEWLNVVGGCHCEVIGGHANSQVCCDFDRLKRTIPIVYEGVHSGTLILCTPFEAKEVASAMENIVNGTLKRLSLARQESLLLTELSSCWESLEALYDIHALPPSCRSVDAIIDWIRSRVVEGEEGLQAEFWLEVEGRLVSKTPRSIDQRSPLLGLDQLIHRALTDQRWIVIDDDQEGMQHGDVPSGWDRSLRLLVAPSVSRHGTRGALVVWGRKGKRPFDSRILRHAQALATQAVMAVEGDQLSTAALENELVQQEMEIGSEMQRILLLGDKPSQLGFAEIASLAIPSQKLGGDFLEFFHLSSSHVDVLIGDVMGKGLRASLVGAAITRQFHRTLCSLMTADPNCHAAPETIVSSVHEGVARRLAEFESFVTLDYARFDAKRRRLEYVDCGHPPILHFHEATGRCDPLYGRNVPLGFSEFEAYEQMSVGYEMGDVFVLYSDGVTELRNQDGELFGLERLISLVEVSARSCTPDELTKVIRRALCRFVGGDAMDDDLTLVVLRMSQNVPLEPPVISRTIEIPSDLERLEECRSFIRSICTEGGRNILNEADLGLLELAVTEVASNIMIHGQEGYSTPRIRLEGEVLDDSVLVRFDYDGKAFDPMFAREPTFDGSRENGFGVFLTSQCVDHVDYNCKGDGANLIVMIKNRS